MNNNNNTTNNKENRRCPGCICCRLLQLSTNVLNAKKGNNSHSCEPPCSKVVTPMNYAVIQTKRNKTDTSIRNRGYIGQTSPNGLFYIWQPPGKDRIGIQCSIRDMLRNKNKFTSEVPFIVCAYHKSMYKMRIILNLTITQPQMRILGGFSDNTLFKI